MGTLYIVPTPIGNLEDITLRAIKVLQAAVLIAAEDTRTSRVLLNHYNITSAVTSYHEHNKIEKLGDIFDALAIGDVALISDAGTPGINDPGYELITEAIKQGVRVEPLPGANAVIPALVGSGLPTDQFTFLGFFPRKAKARRDLLESFHYDTRTLIFYESPNRLLDALEAIYDVFDNREICVAREISKKFEEFVRGDLPDVIAHFRATPPRGEIVIVIGGAKHDESEWDERRVRDALEAHLQAGESLSQAAKKVAKESGWKKRDVYALGTE